MDNPLQTELRKVEARAAAESMLLAANADKIDAAYAIAERVNSKIDNPNLQVQVAVIPHLHSDKISCLIFVNRRQEQVVSQALFDIGIDATMTKSATSCGDLTFDLGDSGCELVYNDQKTERRVA
jgi:hypothetical protein